MGESWFGTILKIIYCIGTECEVKMTDFLGVAIVLHDGATIAMGLE